MVLMIDAFTLGTGTGSGSGHRAFRGTSTPPVRIPAQDGAFAKGRKLADVYGLPASPVQRCPCVRGPSVARSHPMFTSYYVTGLVKINTG